MRPDDAHILTIHFSIQIRIRPARHLHEDRGRRNHFTAETRVRAGSTDDSQLSIVGVTDGEV